MTIQEAIERLEDLSLRRTAWDNPSSFTACRLGIEAIKREIKQRSKLVLTKPVLLPGETKKPKEEN